MHGAGLSASSRPHRKGSKSQTCQSSRSTPVKSKFRCDSRDTHLPLRPSSRRGSFHRSERTSERRSERTSGEWVCHSAFVEDGTPHGATEALLALATRGLIAAQRARVLVSTSEHLAKTLRLCYSHAPTPESGPPDRDVASCIASCIASCSAVASCIAASIAATASPRRVTCARSAECTSPHP